MHSGWCWAYRLICQIVFICDRSSLGAEYNELEQSKKSRMSELNGDYGIKPHLVNSSE